MERAIPLGRLAGIRIGMSWVVPFVALLYVTTLTQGTLPRAVPGHPDSSYWMVGILGAVLFFLSLLVHEMGHALVGRHEGIGVRGITLTLWGGYTQFESETPSPGAELRTSGIGPLSNLALGGLFLLGEAALGGDLGTLGLVAELFGWLGFVNIALAVLNMLPGAPFDGGAVLGAVVWMVTRDRTRAEAITSGVGVVLGVTGAAIGVLLLADGQELGIWLVAIGVMVVLSARSRLRSTAAVGALRATPMRAVMAPDPPVVAEWTTLADVVARAPSWAPHTAFPVQAPDGRITGLLTAELVMAVAPTDWAQVRAADVAWPIARVPVAGVDDPVLTTAQRTHGAAVDRTLVLWPDGRVAGIAGHDAPERALRARAGR